MNPADFDDTCYIVGGGSSLRNFDWADLDGKFVIAINRAYEVLPNAQIVYFTDLDFWQMHRDRMLAHKGKKIKGTIGKETVNNPDVEEYKLSGPQGLETIPKQLRHGYNSTYAAINLAAVHLKFKKIYLLGIDMKWGNQGNKATSHWHSGHKRIDAESVYLRMIKAYDTIGEPLRKLGTEVINITRDSDLKVFPKVDFDTVFGEKYTRRVMGVVKGQEKLLGDHVQAALEKVGGKHVAKVIERITKKPCNCGQRKAWMNKLHQRARELACKPKK
jgi:hypothetical protein